MTTHLEWVFKNTLGGQGYFVYTPANACEDLRTGEANAVLFKLDLSDTARYSWKDHPLLLEIEKIQRGEIPLFRANVLEISDWDELNSAFQLERGWGYIDLLDGSVAEFIAAEFDVGQKKNGEWTSWRFGKIVAVRQRFRLDRIARIAHLVEEYLHQVRKTEPAKIIRIANFLELDAVR
ncbi:MAG: hypothetical protein HYT39_01375 [Candidatus Sungbacteria bacterium]|nr:hypothetical protein [Candidatus Sungbacteria bacterium]